MKIVAYKCEDTGDIFEHEKDYRNHRARFLRQKRVHDSHEQKSNSFKEWLAEEKLKIISISMIGPWILANQKKLMEAANFFRLDTFGHQFKTDSDTFTKYEITNITYNHNLPNSHNCPEGGVTNWGGRVEGAPRGYPGWKCRVSGSLSRNRKDSGSYPYGGVSQLVRVLTGGGGGGNENWSYDADIFLDDWPGLRQQWADIIFDQEVERYGNEKDAIIRRLSGRRYG